MKKWAGLKRDRKAEGFGYCPSRQPTNVSN